MAAGADPVDLAYVDRLDAAALARTGRYDEALPLFEQARVTFAERGMPEDVDRTVVGLVQARFQLGQPVSPEDLDVFEATASRLTPSESVAMGSTLPTSRTASTTIPGQTGSIRRSPGARVT